MTKFFARKVSPFFDDPEEFQRLFSFIFCSIVAVGEDHMWLRSGSDPFDQFREIEVASSSLLTRNVGQKVLRSESIPILIYTPPHFA